MKLSRRRFLRGVSIGALMVGAPTIADAWIHGSAAAATFGGNPNAVISAIDTSGGIIMSRASGTCIPANSNGVTSPGSPAFVQVSASAIAATGTITSPNSSIGVLAPMDLELTWNFGDASGTETFVAANGQTYNANSGQTGNEAAYAYRTAGTKTITLTCRGKNGSGGYISTTVTSTFTVTDVSGTFATRFCDQRNGSDANNGTTPALAVATPQRLTAVITSNCVAYIAQGSVWQDAAGVNVAGNLRFLGNKSGIKITSYVGVSGAGANPLIQVSGTSNSTFAAVNIALGTQFGTGAPANDYTFTHIDGVTNSVNGVCNVSPVNMAGAPNDPSGTLLDIYFDNCNFSQLATQTNSGTLAGNPSLGNTYCRVYTPLAGDVQRIGSWNCNYATAVSPLPTGAWGVTLGVGASQWVFVVGGTVRGDCNDLGGRSHSIYSHNGSHSMWRWISTAPATGTTTLNKVYAINLEQDLLPGTATVNTGTSQIGSITGSTGVAGQSATFNVTGNSWSPIRPIQIGMFLFNTGIPRPPQITAASNTSISTITYNSGTNLATLTTAAPHGITTNFFVWITISGTTPSAYNATVLAKSTGASTLTFTPLSNPGGNATVVGTLTGITFTATPDSITILANVAGSACSFGVFSALCWATYDKPTTTVTIQSGSLVGSVNVGEVANNVASSPGANNNWGKILTTTGSPVSSFTVLPVSSSMATTTVPQLLTLTTAQYPTVVDSTLIDGCELAAVQYGYSGNFSDNDASIVIYNNYIVQNCSFKNLQFGGTVANCINLFTLRNNRVWSATGTMVNGFFDLTNSTGALASTANWRIYGNLGYFSSAQTGKFINQEHMVPSGNSMPYQITDNKFWNDATNNALVGLNATGSVNSLIDRNFYYAPNSPTPFMDAVATSVNFAAWQALGINFDPNSTFNVTLTTPFSGWTVPPAQWSDFGP